MTEESSLKVLKTEDELLNTKDERFYVKYNSDAHELLQNYFTDVYYEMIEYGSWYDTHLQITQNPENEKFYKYVYEATKIGEGAGDDIEVIRVYPKQITKTIYVEKSKL